MAMKRVSIGLLRVSSSCECISVTQFLYYKRFRCVGLIRYGVVKGKTMYNIEVEVDTVSSVVI
jgi:hypothetical protein